MNRGPIKGRGPVGAPRYAEKVQGLHGEAAPDWLIELAALADREGLAGAEKRIGYSRSAISTIISGKYAGDIGRVEEMVRGALMALSVECPVLGEIGRDRCLQEQKEPFRATSRHRAQIFHACRGGCPHSKLKNESEQKP